MIAVLSPQLRVAEQFFCFFILVSCCLPSWLNCVFSVHSVLAEGNFDGLRTKTRKEEQIVVHCEACCGELKNGRIVQRASSEATGGFCAGACVCVRVCSAAVPILQARIVGVADSAAISLAVAAASASSKT